MNDQKRILDMIEAGTITAAEGMELLNALNEKSEPDTHPVEVVALSSETTDKKTYNFLKIRVVTDNEDTKVNVNIPLKLVKSVSGIASNIEGFIPSEAKETMNEQGINLSNIDINGILEAIEEGSIDGPLVDIDVNEDGEKTKVLIYVE